MNQSAWLPHKMKKAILFLYFKIHRFIYFYKYRIPINDKYSYIPSGVVSPLIYFKGVNSVAEKY